jgi:hypothetical protein
MDRVHKGQEAIKIEAVRYFSNFYKESEHNSCEDQIAIVRLYPRIVTEEEVNTLESPCTTEEINEVLKGFTKDKSLGPDGWTVEFFLNYFDLVAKDLLEAVEESRLSGEVKRSLNSNFIALIPKVNGPATFGDFRPIALCNLCYKIISKIIAKRIRPILSRALSEEQFGFLKGRQIIDAIGMAQECLHSIREKKLQALILKIDLKKAYDCVSWDYLRLVLMQCGFGLPTIKWIMGCVSSATYAILINGEPTDFFNSGRGLRQGCPLSPLLFILVMEGLSLALKDSQAEGNITGIKVSRFIKVLHLLFVDDILIMTKASLSEWLEIKRILDNFCGASGLVINAQKTSFLHYGIQPSLLDTYKPFFHFNFLELASGFKYLGYFLKMDRYTSEDWNWLIEKFEKRISHWCNRWLSLGGRLVLIKVVLESQPVYWLALSNLPSSILNNLRQLMFNFLWSGSRKKEVSISATGSF